MLTYEELLADPANWFIVGLAHFGVSAIDDTLVAEMVEAYRFDNMAAVGEAGGRRVTATRGTIVTPDGSGPAFSIGARPCLTTSAEPS